MDNIVLQKIWTQGKPVVIDNLLGTAFTGEAGAHTFKISGVDAAGAAVQISGTITGKFLAQNNATVALSGSVSNGVAQLTLTDECYAVPGRFILSIYATTGDTTLCIYCAIGNVFKTSSSTVAYPTTDLPDLTELMADLEEILDGWPADYTQLQTDVSNLKTALQSTEQEIVFSLIGNDAFIIHDSGNVQELQSGLYTYTDYVDVSMYKTIMFSRPGTTASASGAGMAFYNENKTYISGVQIGLGQDSVGYMGLYGVDVPVNAVYARFTTYKDTTTYGIFELNGITAINMRGFSDVMSFGAVGDGVVDDTDAINNAVALSDIVVFGAGTYLITDSIKITHPVCLIGGAGSKIIAKTTAYNVFIDVAQNIDNVHIDGLTLEMDGNGSTRKSAIVFNGGNNDFVVKNCKIKKATGHGIVVIDGHDGIIDNCVIENPGVVNGDGVCIREKCTNITVSNCSVSDTTAGGIAYEIEGRSSTSLPASEMVSNCRIINCTAVNTVDKSYLIINAENCAIVDCKSFANTNTALNIIKGDGITVKNFLSLDNDGSPFSVEPETFGTNGYSSNIIIDCVTDDVNSPALIKGCSCVDIAVKVTGELKSQYLATFDTSSDICLHDVYAVQANADSKTHACVYLKNVISNVNIHDVYCKACNSLIGIDSSATVNSVNINDCFEVDCASISAYRYPNIIADGNINALKSFVTESVSGNPVILSDGAENIPLKSLSVSGTGNVDIMRVGKNLLDWNGIDWTVGKLINASGDEVDNQSYKHSDYFSILPSTQYTFSVSYDTAPGIWHTLAYYDSGKNFIERVTVIEGPQTGRSSGTFTTPSNAAYSIMNAHALGYEYEPMLEYGDVATTFAPYQSQSISIIAGETVYNQLSTALGSNTITASSGTLSIVYRADTKLYIENVISGTS